MKRWRYDLSHFRPMTLPMGYLIPCCLMEVLPGDIWRQSTAAIMRLEQMYKPMLTPLQIRIHHWYCPNRILWTEGDESGDKGWQTFITGGEDGADNQVHPYITFASVAAGDLADYLGIPVGSNAGNWNALPFRMYNMVYNENYRDQDLVTALSIDLGEGADTTTPTALKKVAWGKDAFTSARPWQQKGSTITIPLQDNAPIYSDMLFNGVNGAGNIAQIEDSAGNLKQLVVDATIAGTAAVYGSGSSSGTTQMYADLSEATGIDIQELRTALGLQRFQERMAKGSRYTEYLKGLGVLLPDYRAQLPEYLGGGKNLFQVSEVLSTDGTNTGKIYGHGIGAMRTNSFVRMFMEHGFVMSLVSVVPVGMYEDSLHKMWFRETKYDYFQKELQYVGEQEVLNKEVQLSHSSPDAVFGYRPRYDSYRFHPSTVHGDFIANEDDWHMVRQFSGDVALNQSFIECTPTNRIFASTTYDPIKAQFRNIIHAKRAVDPRPKARF